jgi:undecaprenyl-diphosphatase
MPMTTEPSLLERAEALDDKVFDTVAGWTSPVLDRVLPGLSVAASYSRIWMAIAALLAIFGGSKGRKTAIEGLVAVGVTSFLANVVLKGLTRRHRPTEPVPDDRSLPKPDSSSFPSGHTASAAAFSGVVGREYPALWLPLNALAALIGFSRVYTGVHYPGDVLGGWLLGKGVASVTLRVAPRVEARVEARCKERRARSATGAQPADSPSPATSSTAAD